MAKLITDWKETKDYSFIGLLCRCTLVTSAIYHPEVRVGIQPGKDEIHKRCWTNTKLVCKIVFGVLLFLLSKCVTHLMHNILLFDRHTVCVNELWDCRIELFVWVIFASYWINFKVCRVCQESHKNKLCVCFVIRIEDKNINLTV